VITDHLASHWRLLHPSVAGQPPAHPRQVFIPVGACWLNLQEAWWRIFRRAALAGQRFACPEEIALATRMATCQLNAVPAPGSGAVHDPHHATGAASSPTEFKERSTSVLSR
jgi:hypothetical protein